MSIEAIVALCMLSYLSGAVTALLVAIRVVKREGAASTRQEKP